MDFHIVKMYEDKVVNKNAKNICLSMCDVKVSFHSPGSGACFSDEDDVSGNLTKDHYLHNCWFTAKQEK
jgi:hypothetical protein